MILYGLKFFYSFISPFLRLGKDSFHIAEKDPNHIINYLPAFSDHKKRPSALCMTRAYSIYKYRFSSSLGPLILLAEKKDTFSFALLYCAHTANILYGNKFSYTRLYQVDRFTAKKYYTFSETEFHDLAVAHTKLSRAFCQSNIMKTPIKSINSSNIGDGVRIISINGSSKEVISKIRAVNDDASNLKQDPSYHDLIQIDIQGIPGDSGSPVLTLDNELIGLIVKTDTEGYAYCNKLFEAKGLISNLYENSNIKADLNEIYMITQ